MSQFGSQRHDVRKLWHTRIVAKRPRDPAQLAKQVFDIAIGEAEDTVSEAKATSIGRAQERH